jgi:alpha-L-fucosidase
MRIVLAVIVSLIIYGNLMGQDFYPSWESLKNQTVPQWYQEGKFGIFIHWGVYSVPAFGSEWYPRIMYMKESDIYKHHLETYGPQSEFGYKDFIPLFRAEKWNPEEWADLFVKAGAKFVVPVAEHHDGFPMYDCSYTVWDAYDMGPKRDLINDLSIAVKKRGLKFGVSSHRAFNWSYYPRGNEFDTNNPFYWGLYGVGHEGPGGATEYTHGDGYLRTSDSFLKDWYARTTELVDKYQPDLVWFDWVINRQEFEPWLQKFAAHYYNKSIEWKKGVVINYKYDAFPKASAVLDVERGKLGNKSKRVWQTDTSVGKKSWGYIKDEEYKSVNDLVDQLIDIASKNGVLLLNIGPKADGSIPEEAREILLEIGKWLDVNGEAIYGTRPWRIYGEGPTEEFGGAHQESKNKTYTAQDVRYLLGPDDDEVPLYAIALDYPDNEFNFPALRTDANKSYKKVNEVRMLGYADELEWTQSESGLKISLPDKKPCEHAFCFVIN